MDLKERLIAEVAEELNLPVETCKQIINHQFNTVKLFIHNNPVGEIHLPRLGRLVSTVENQERFEKAMAKRKEVVEV